MIKDQIGEVLNYWGYDAPAQGEHMQTAMLKILDFILWADQALLQAGVQPPPPPVELLDAQGQRLKLVKSDG